MLTKFRTEKSAPDRVEVLVESLAQSMDHAMQAAKAKPAKGIFGKPHRANAGGGVNPRTGMVLVRGGRAGQGKTHLLVRLAINDLERTHPGRCVAFLDKEILALAEQIREHLPEIREAQSGERIAKLIDALVEFNDPLAVPRQKIDKANAELRVRFMREFETYSSTTPAELNQRKNVSNPHNLASRWKTEGKIFAIDWQGQRRFPAFQFDHGKPRPIIGQLLAILKGSFGPWETAFWFVSSNKWLDGKSPVRLLDDAEALLRAAHSTTGEHFG